MTEASAQRPFDPSADLPPEGAEVKTSEGIARFVWTGVGPHWLLADGRMARPFDSLGLLFNQRWAATLEPRPEDPS